MIADPTELLAASATETSGTSPSLRLRLSLRRSRRIKKDPAVHRRDLRQGPKRACKRNLTIMASDLLRTTRKAIYTMADRRLLPGVRIGRRLLIPRRLW